MKNIALSIMVSLAAAGPLPSFHRPHDLPFPTDAFKVPTFHGVLPTGLQDLPIPTFSIPLPTGLQDLPIPDGFKIPTFNGVPLPTGLLKDLPIPTGGFTIPNFSGFPFPSGLQDLPIPTDGFRVPTFSIPLPTPQGPMPTLFPKSSAINGLHMPTLYPLGNGNKVPEAMKDFNHDALASVCPSMANFPDYVPMANGSVLSPTQAAQWDWDLSDFIPVYNGSVVPLPTPTIPLPDVPTAFVTVFPSYNFTGDKDVHFDPPTVVSDPETNEYVVKIKGHVNETADFIEDLRNNLPFLFPPVTNVTCPRPQTTKYCHPEHCHHGHCHEKHCHKKQEIDDLKKVDPDWVWSSTSTDRKTNPCAFQRAHREQVSEALARLHPNGTQPINRRLYSKHLQPTTLSIVPISSTSRVPNTAWRHHVHSTRIDAAYFASVAATNPAVRYVKTPYPRPTVTY